MSKSRCLILAPLWLAISLGLISCMPASPISDSPAIADHAPAGAAEGTCWHRNTSPAVIETITEQVLVQPAKLDALGQITQPAVFRTITRQDIVQPRRDSWIEIPCPDQITPEFVASVQRALRARGYYRGAITGQMDRSTRIALRRYQTDAGLNSSALSLDTARQLGLITIAQ